MPLLKSRTADGIGLLAIFRRAATMYVAGKCRGAKSLFLGGSPLAGKCRPFEAIDLDCGEWMALPGAYSLLRSALESWRTHTDRAVCNWLTL